MEKIYIIMREFLVGGIWAKHVAHVFINKFAAKQKLKKLSSKSDKKTELFYIETHIITDFNSLTN